jgi:stearoyl-CoA desaturase (delta-9 desaturase)
MKTKVWQRSIGAWMFFPVAYACYTSGAGLAWWISSFALYILIALTVTVGYHRLFCHSAFETSSFWHWLFGLVGCITLNTSPVQWSAVHIAHHKFSDTDKDPYDSDIRHYLRFRERNDIPPTKNEVRLLRNPAQKLFLDHSLTFCLIYAILTLMGGVNVFLFLWALPTTAYLVTAGMHTILAHSGRLQPGDTRRSTARNLWALEFIIPMGGEWLHREHHEKPGLSDWSTKPYYYDMGAHLIKLIGKNAKQPS